MLDLVAQSPGLRLLLLSLLFAIVVATAYFAAQAITQRQETRRRLLQGQGAATPEVMPALGSLRNERVQSTWLKLVNSIEKRGLSLVDTKDVTVRQSLIAAGFPASYAPRVYTLLRLALVIGLPVLVLLYFAASGSSPSMLKLYLSLVIAAAIGLYVPALYVRARADRRQREIVNGFPDALDLMLVCVEAGLGMLSCGK